LISFNLLSQRLTSTNIGWLNLQLLIVRQTELEVNSWVMSCLVGHVDVLMGICITSLYLRIFSQQVNGDQASRPL
jgi:hypothetical protein